MSDLINRADAIEAVDALWRVTGNAVVAKVWQQLKDLPSAEPHWISVSERLPEKDDRYLITTFGIFKREYVEMACFSTASKTWTQYDLEYGYVPVDDVIAWMPLPEPYRKGEQE